MPDTVSILHELPKCSFCERKALYDFKSIIGGQWAYGCIDHWRIYRMHESLGAGKGQALILR